MCENRNPELREEEDNNIEINETPVTGEEQETSTSVQEDVETSSDGTYSYSYRKAVDNPEEYRKPPYMRDEVGKGMPGGEPQVQPRLKEFKGIRSANSDSGNASEDDSRRTDRVRSDYSYDDRSGKDSGSSNRYSYDNDSNGRRNSYQDGRRGRNSRKNNKKTFFIIAGALLLGGLIGAACWSAGSLIRPSGGTSALEEVQQNIQENGPSEVTGGDTGATENGAAGNSSGESVIPTAPSAELAENSTLISDLPDVVDLAMPSIVAISTKYVYENYSQYGYNPFFGYYGNDSGSDTYEVEGAGSGIIIGDDGTELWIVTNNHVVEDSDEVTVGFCDDEHVNAYIKGTDASNDLAVVGVKLADLKDTTKAAIRAVQMGDSDSLRLGETVIAIGNALGIGQSVTTGIVSAVNREITTSENTTLTTIQTDAAINPGNSGGALLNVKGELIGINVAKGSDENVEGMGYAIPISSARSIIEKLTTMEPRVPVDESEYPYLGVELKDVSESYAQAYGIPVGILVYSVQDNSPAQAGGLLQQDLITAIEGVSVTTYNELTSELQYYAAGTEITLTVARLESGQYVDKELKITLGRKADYQTKETESSQKEQQNSNGWQKP